MRQVWVVLAGVLLASSLQAQQAVPEAMAAPAAATAAAPQEAEGASPTDSTPPGPITTLGEVRALAPDEQSYAPVDLYRFRNPVRVPPNRFDKGYQPPPSVKEVSEGGGYLMYGLNYALGKAMQGVNKLSGGPDQIQAAVARPPPLSEAQMRRAAELCAAQADACGSEAGR